MFVGEKCVTAHILLEGIFVNTSVWERKVPLFQSMYYSSLGSHLQQCCFSMFPSLSQSHNF